MDNFQDFKHNIVKDLHKAVKLCQAEFVNKSEVATESNITVFQLCKEFESVFFHGIKKRSRKSIFSLKYNITEIPNNFIQQIKPLSNINNYSFWSFICEILEQDEIMRFTYTLDKIDNDVGRCRAWLRSAINERTLEPFLVKVVSKVGQNIAKKYYDSHAVILDAEENSVLPNLAAGVSSIVFSLELNNESFNYYSESSNHSQNNSTSSSVSRPILFSSSTSDSFEDIEIAESSVKPVNNELNSKTTSRKKTRIINIMPIEDGDDGTSDFSDSYSPFNLLKTSVLNTGLNLVSKFQFGNDEKLINTQEQDHKSPTSPNIVNSSHISSSSSNITGLANNCFHEFEETQFEDCCLSLQKEYYFDLNNKLQANNASENAEFYFVTCSSPDLLPVNTICTDSSHFNNQTQSSEKSLPYSTKSEPNHDNSHNTNNYIHQSQESINLKNQLLLKSQDYERLLNELNLIKKEFEERDKQSSETIAKLSRENELLKKRLKTVILKNESNDEKIEEFDNFMANAEKADQLLQMHADILELNDQLQRSIVNKDIKISLLQSKISNLMAHEESTGIHFEKCGTIFIGIVDYFQRGHGSQKHFCYKIHIRYCPVSPNLIIVENDEWTTCRRYKEFHSFYLEFIEQYPNMKYITFPSKWLYKPTEEQLMDRQKGLESFLRTTVMCIFQNTLKNNKESLSKPVTYESFKKLGRFVRGITVSTNSSLNSLNRSDESVSGLNNCDVDKITLSRHFIIDIIPFLSPNSEEI